MSCDCPVCKDRDINKDALDFAEREVIPFVTKELIKPKYPTHPWPRKYKGLLASLCAYSQAMYWDIIHKQEVPNKYFTANKWLLKFKDELNEKFPQLVICDAQEIHDAYKLREVCEFNVGE